MAFKTVIRAYVIVAVAAGLAGPPGTAETATPEPESGLVLDGDIVREWRNPKLAELTRLTDLAPVTEQAKDEPVLIFKHSTTCPISGRAAQRVDKWLRESEDKLPAFYMVKVIESRPVSNAIAERYNVKHESPQVLLLNDGEAVWNASHDDITPEAIEAAMEQYLNHDDAESNADNEK